MAHLRQQAPTDPDGPRAVLELMVRPWAPAAVNEHVRLVLGDVECAASDAVWVEISYGLAGAPLTYLRRGRAAVAASTNTCASTSASVPRSAAAGVDIIANIRSSPAL